MNRKGIELSINMIVVLIISVLLFAMAISFLWDWFGKAESLKAELDRQSEEQIIAALSQGNKLVSIPINVKRVERGDPAVFGVGVRNVGSPRTFSGRISFSDAYFPDGRRNPDVDAAFVEEQWLGNFFDIPSFNLERNEIETLPLLIKASNRVSSSKSTVKGDYVFNLCIFKSDTDDYCEPSLLGQDILYSDRIYQLTVRVI